MLHLVLATVARVARMLALAHDLQAKLDRGEHPDQATLAAQLGFTRGRLSKLLDLTLLAPDIQEEVLHLEAVDGVEPMSERDLRGAIAVLDWTDQNEGWKALQCHAPHYCDERGFKKSTLIARLIRDHLNGQGFQPQHEVPPPPSKATGAGGER